MSLSKSRISNSNLFLMFIMDNDKMRYNLKIRFKISIPSMINMKIQRIMYSKIKNKLKVKTYLRISQL